MHLHRLLRGRAGPHAHVRGLRRPQGQHQALQDLQYLSVGLLDTKNKTQKQAEDKILLFSEETNYGTNDRFNVKAQVHIPNAIAESKSKKSKNDQCLILQKLTSPKPSPSPKRTLASELVLWATATHYHPPPQHPPCNF